MRYRFTRRRVLVRACSPLALALSLAAAPAVAQTVSDAPVNLDLGSVLATATGAAADLVHTPGTAPYEAPSKAPLNSSQPTSQVTHNTISNMTTGTESFADIARLTPSVSTIDPNGPGLQESNGPVLRGFQDGQYNVTFDGIPFGDSNDFTHHSTSFFAAHQIGQMIIDRGPGTAETVGDATFGGTMSIRTIDPSAQRSVTPYGEWGSWDTNIGGVTLNTGSIQSANGTSAVIDAEHMQSNGGKTNTPQERSNFFGKVMVPVNAGTVVTVMVDYNKLFQSFDTGATAAQMAMYGSDYGNSTDPTSQGYYKYNTDHITTDMEYIDLQSNFGNGWLYDGKLYTYAYDHRGMNDVDPTQGIIAGNVVTTTGTIVSGVPLQQMEMAYRSFGTIQRLQKNLSFGDVKTGLWYDWQYNTRFQGEYVYVAGQGILPNYTGYPSPTPGNYGQIDRLQHNQLYTLQPYGQIDWKPIDGLTLTAGVKYSMFRRTMDAPYNQGTQTALGYDHTWGKLLPSAEVRYAFNPNFTVYAQAAEGFLAPNMKILYIPNPSNSNFKPETTINFQAGGTYQNQNLALSADVYNIHFQNYMQKVSAGPNSYYTNIGGVIYRGIEGEAAYTLGYGLTAFANAGYNEAFQTGTKDYVAQAPQGTANFGLIYDKDGLYASIMDQWTGGEYSGNGGTGTTATNPYANSPAVGKSPGGWYDPYNVVNLAVAYTFNHADPNRTPVKVKLNVDNLTNNKQVIFDQGYFGVNGDQLAYTSLTGISAFVNLEVPINF
ncbi:TonB-dependent receptor [Acidocella sp.]|uniref:TonB-dependent receptor n=1 Tax=Acidocella sp. TaxID=50710 RepID=UPI002619CDA8|nr:TonB-dependent receptor [Acidocella sp.]